MTDKSGETLEIIIGDISKVSPIVGEITLALNEQSNGITQEGTAITQMD